MSPRNVYEIDLPSNNTLRIEVCLEFVLCEIVEEGRTIATFTARQDSVDNIIDVLQLLKHPNGK